DTKANRNHTNINEEVPPNKLFSRWPNGHWRKGLQVVLESGRNIVSGTFVLIYFEPKASTIKIGCVTQIWQLLTSNNVVFKVTKIKFTTGLHPVYGMREVKETQHLTWIDIKINHVWSQVTPAEWQVSIERGLLAWFERCPPKDLGNNAVDDSMQEDEDPLGQIHV
ncbi:hypothetical protein DFH28DRAFT_898932, partial [Melampsora americana]